jgi:hypothetical protein
MAENKTAVEWLVEQMFGEHTRAWQKQINQAKALEKYQLHQAYNAGRKNGEKRSELNFNDFLQTYKTDTL